MFIFVVVGFIVAVSVVFAMVVSLFIIIIVIIPIITTFKKEVSIMHRAKSRGCHKHFQNEIKSNIRLEDFLLSFSLSFRP